MFGYAQTPQHQPFREGEWIKEAGLCLLIELCMTARRWEYYWNIRPSQQLCRILPFLEYRPKLGNWVHVNFNQCCNNNSCKSKFVLFSSYHVESPLQTSLNSGFKVLFLICVLHLPFFPMSGFRHLWIVHIEVIFFFFFCHLQIQNEHLILLYLHFDIWIRVAISIHGGQVDAAHDTHDEPVGLGAVHEWHQNPTTLLYLSALLPRLKQSRRREIQFSGTNEKICAEESVTFRHAG